MMNYRVAQYTSLDQGYTRRMAETEERKEKAHQNALKRKYLEELRKEESKRVIDSVELNQLLDGEDEDEFAEPSNKSHIRTVKTGTTIFIPHDIVKKKNSTRCDIHKK